jgi:hypothetical protein|tara:strand:- start:59 stop:661 length:603 start_codon:yes stop_codon:yes gene_type:complete
MKKKLELGDKKKLIEIKKKFKVDDFNKILSSKGNNNQLWIDLFDVISKLTKVEISCFDELHIEKGIVKFFEKISHNLLIEPIIQFWYTDYRTDFSTEHYFCLLKCVLNKKNDFKYYLVQSYWFDKGAGVQGDLICEDLFDLNQKISNKELLTIMNFKIKQKSKSSKFFAKEVHLLKKLNWSKAILKKSIQKIRNTNIKFY